MSKVLELILAFNLNLMFCKSIFVIMEMPSPTLSLCRLVIRMYVPVRILFICVCIGGVSATATDDAIFVVFLEINRTYCSIFWEVIPNKDVAVLKGF